MELDNKKIFSHPIVIIIIFLIKEIFIVSFFFFVTLLFLEDLKPLFVKAYLNLRLILLISLSSGIITLITSKHREKILKSGE